MLSRYKMRHVQAWIRVPLLPGPHLLEKTVPKYNVFRNIVAWTGGPLPIDLSFCSNNPINYSAAATPIHLPPPQLPQFNMLRDPGYATTRNSERDLQC